MKMQNDLLFALLGFTGDVIVEENDTFRVRDGYDGLKESEKDQINRISPLGWIYIKLFEFTQKYDVGWGKMIDVNKFEAYKIALAQGLNDLLQAYTDDITYLEQQIVGAELIPLSYVMQYFQKVSK
jgi:hypothetical protein